jgi:hypothetical protein
MNKRWLAVSLALVTVGILLVYIGWTSRACTLAGCPESAKHAPRLVVRWYGIGFSDGCNVCTLNTPALLGGLAALLGSYWAGRNAL